MLQPFPDVWLPGTIEMRLSRDDRDGVDRRELRRRVSRLPAGRGHDEDQAVRAGRLRSRPYGRLPSSRRCESHDAVARSRGSRGDRRVRRRSSRRWARCACTATTRRLTTRCSPWRVLTVGSLVTDESIRQADRKAAKQRPLRRRRGAQALSLDRQPVRHPRHRRRGRASRQ